MKESARGAAAILLAYVMWGLLPLYWRAIASVGAMEILAQRICWSFLFMLALVALRRELGPALRDVAQKKTPLMPFLASSAAVSLNWGIYIWGVNNGEILETSLGYFINPLVTVLFGIVFFRERPSTMQFVALSFAAAGIAVQIAVIGRVPLISLSLALTFGLYSLCKKKIHAEARRGLLIETAILSPFALAWLLYLQSSGASHFPYDARVNLLLAGTGLLTSVPLILFSWGVQRTQLTTSGIIQFASPTLSFLLAVFYYHEPISAARLSSFALIWIGLAIYMADSLRRNRTARSATS